MKIHGYIAGLELLALIAVFIFGALSALAGLLSALAYALGRWSSGPRNSGRRSFMAVARWCGWAALVCGTIAGGAWLYLP